MGKAKYKKTKAKERRFIKLIQELDNYESLFETMRLEIAKVFKVPKELLFGG